MYTVFQYLRSCKLHWCTLQMISSNRMRFWSLRWRCYRSDWSSLGRFRSWPACYNRATSQSNSICILKQMIYKLKPIISLVCMDIGAKVSQFSLIQLMFTDIIWSSYLKITKVWREIPATSQIVSQKFNKIHFFNEFFMMTVILVNASLILGFFAGH